MAALQFADLLKELKGTTIPRWTVLVNKIKKKDTFVIDKTTQEVKLNYLDKNIQGLFEQGKITDIQTTYRGQELFKASNGRKLKLGDIFKSSDFGGGKGSGGGADGSPAGPNVKAPSASANTASGGGGGGGTQGSNPSSGGDGGSGIIYVAYEV